MESIIEDDILAYIGSSELLENPMMMMMMMMMMKCSCGIAHWGKGFSLISNRNHVKDPHHRETLTRLEKICRTCEHAQSLSSGFVEWNCAVVITTTRRYHSWMITSTLGLFLKNSCQSNLLLMLNFYSELFENGPDADSVYLDFAKAFD